jgi:hypothetical protein
VEYKTEMERKSFEAIKNPSGPSERLKEMARKFGFVPRNEKSNQRLLMLVTMRNADLVE